jgi:hypothetical protein
MRIKKNTVYLLIGLIVLGILVWVAYDLPERQRQNRLDDYNDCVQRRTKELNTILVSCGNGYLNGNPCPPFLVDKTIEKIEEVKNECRDIYINN